MAKIQNFKGAAGDSIVAFKRHRRRRVRGVFRNFGHWDLEFFWDLEFRDLESQH
jgi:hypothetical protein